MDTLQPTEVSNGRFSLVGLSHKGLCRSDNEDRYLIKALPGESVLAAVADGVSGGGEWAAQTVIETLAGLTRIPSGRELPALQQMAGSLDRTVHAGNYRNDEFQGMGSTLVCALLSQHRLYWVHVGDSRLYLWRNNTLSQVTRDQTLARFLLTEGEITPQQAKDHYSRDVLDQYIGCGHCEPETGWLDIQAGDRVLLCSDGLYRGNTQADLSDALDTQRESAAAAGELLSAALRSGGQDNISLVIGTILSTTKESDHEKG